MKKRDVFTACRDDNTYWIIDPQIWKKHNIIFSGNDAIKYWQEIWPPKSPYYYIMLWKTNTSNIFDGQYVLEVWNKSWTPIFAGGKAFKQLTSIWTYEPKQDKLYQLLRRRVNVSAGSLSRPPPSTTISTSAWNSELEIETKSGTSVDRPPSWL